MSSEIKIDLERLQIALDYVEETVGLNIKEKGDFYAVQALQNRSHEIDIESILSRRLPHILYKLSQTSPAYPVFSKSTVEEICNFLGIKSYQLFFDIDDKKIKHPHDWIIPWE